jgi:hypothetical protein
MSLTVHRDIHAVNEVVADIVNPSGTRNQAQLERES